MKAEAMVQHANNVLLFAQKAVDLRRDASNYRGLGKKRLAELLEQEADEAEQVALDLLAHHKAAPPNVQA